MAEINIDNTGEVLSRRDVRRNSSNQIISYTLPDDSDKGYGLQRIPAQTTVFGLTSYDRVIDKLSGELLDNIPDIGLRYTKKFTFNESGTEAVLFTNEKPDANMESFVREGAAQIDRIQGNDLTPAQILQNAVNEARQSLINIGFTEREVQWIQEESDLLVRDIISYFEEDNTRTPDSWFRLQLLNIPFFDEEFIDWMLSAAGMDYIDWIEYIQTLKSENNLLDNQIQYYVFQAGRTVFGLPPI